MELMERLPVFPGSETFVELLLLGGCTACTRSCSLRAAAAATRRAAACRPGDKLLPIRPVGDLDTVRLSSRISWESSGASCQANRIETKSSHQTLTRAHDEE